MRSVLEGVLRKPIVESDRTRRYQSMLDREVDQIRADWDVDRGMIGTRGLALPHETVPGYWFLSEDERKKITPSEVETIYGRNCGRTGTAMLCKAAFCWYSPLSRHCDDPHLLRFFTAGLKFHIDSIRDDGFTATLSAESWGHGWHIEGLIYGMIFCRSALDASLMANVRKRLRLSAKRYGSLVQTPGIIGSYGNQRCVYILGLYLCGAFLEVPEYIEMADRHWRETLPIVLDESGQVIEQIGPCMHYSYTTFIYAWLNLVLRGDETRHDRVRRCLDWFRLRHTESLYPIAGPSSRMYNETISKYVSNLWPATEQLAHLDPSLREFVDRAMACFASTLPPGDRQLLNPASHHAGSPLIWAILMTQQESKIPTLPRPALRAVVCYEGTHLIRRAPLRYLLVRRRYQTHFNFTDFLPFSGIQTWALDDEPPIIHPTPPLPSTTEAHRLDTARQGVSHNWGLYGAGVIGIDGYFHPAECADEIDFLVARYDWLWRLVFFTELSTVVLEFGKGGRRRTVWTLNRNDPSEPQIGDGIVRFANCKARLHTTLATCPQIISSSSQHAQARAVRQLAYECGDGVAAFAFSDDSFRFAPSQPLVDRLFHFSDSEGRYEVTIHEGFLRAENPGNFSIDTWQLAHRGTTAKRVG